MILPSKLTIGLGIALACSLAGNALLGWQWAQAKPECAQKRTGDVLAGVVEAADSKVKTDKVSSSISQASETRTAAAIAKADKTAEQTQESISDAYKNQHPDPVPAGPCVVLRPVPDRVQHAIDAAVERSNAESR